MDNVRHAKDTVGFCWDAAAMDRFALFLASLNPELRPGNPLIAGICPHDDFLYAGDSYFRIMSRIICREIVIFGTAHRAVRDSLRDPHGIVIMDSHDAWMGPYGDISVSPLREELIRELPSSMCVVNDAAHDMEHSIEALLPFAQHFNRTLRITPIIVSAMDLPEQDRASGELARVIGGYMRTNNLKPGKDIAFLISSDANHYGADFDNHTYGEGEWALRRGMGYDRGITGAYLEGDMRQAKIDGFFQKTVAPTGEDPFILWCGRYAISLGLRTCLKIVDAPDEGRLRGELLSFGNSCANGVLPFRETGMGLTSGASLEHWVNQLSVGYRIAL